ncbi:hypothetical protein H2201_002702 [Coniosporium apollinis]|uniref:Malate dehydrogenase n=1 Tax=Coniosporium apollinis TaxID=61459 RepID=A0ABQ9NYJ2_9PEZI|nr:hypothetical protein H2201_002702 [Coniosporium apollinis]
MHFSIAATLLIALNPLPLLAFPALSFRGVENRPNAISAQLAWDALLGKRGPATASVALDGPPCDMSLAKMPSAGLALSHVVVGRGTQNYTCASPTDTPKPAGALASLYDASCIAASYPSLLAAMPPVALDNSLPKPVSANKVSKNSITPALAGTHYFTNLTTPFFDMDTALHAYGRGGFAKVAGTPAPEGAPVGPKGRGNGSVPWLKLGSVSADEGWQEVYRVNTAGGQPPSSCEGMPKTFTVEYAAEYWMWKRA